MRALAALLLIAMPPPAVATPRQDIRAELRQIKDARPVYDVRGMPKALQRSLVRIYRDRHLDLASTGEPVREFHGLIVGDPESGADSRRPTRRLIFAFETSSFWVVYYERRAPVAGAALVFAKSPQPEFLWGGVDFDQPWARSPRALAHRILQNRLNDEHDYLW